MPKLIHSQSNFTAGELSPRMKARGDVARYQNGAEIIENGVVVVHGGVLRRNGTRFLQATKYPTRKSRLIRFVLSVSQSFMLEFGHNYVRFYNGSNGSTLLDDALATLEVASPYTEDQLDEITTKQSVDVMYLFHPDVPPHILRRLTPTQWALYPIPFAVLPFTEAGHQPAARLSLSAATIGAGRTFTTSPVTAPDAPVIGTANALNAAAVVNFTPPANNGGLPIDHYTVTSSPGGITATGSGSPIVVTGLTNFTAYTFTVTATQGAGTSVASAASNSVSPNPSASPAVVTVTSADVSTRVADGLVLSITGPTATPTTGVAPFTYTWSKLSGNAGITLKTVNAATVILDSEGYGDTNFATLRCAVVDSFGQSGQVDVNVSIRHGYPTNWKDDPFEGL